MFPSTSAVLDRTEVLKHWDQEYDTVNEQMSKGDSIEFPTFYYDHDRKLTRITAKKAHDYIRELVKVYPFQLRHELALPLWERFAEAWCETGDEAKALGAI